MLAKFTRSQVAIVFLLALTGRRLEAAPTGNWLEDAWRVEEGLPDNTVDAIAQTPDGYLWLGTPVAGTWWVVIGSVVTFFVGWLSSLGFTANSLPASTTEIAETHRREG